MMQLDIVLQHLKKWTDFPAGGLIINDPLSNFERVKLLKHRSQVEDTYTDDAF